jgi:hypothetical protein
MLGRVPLVAHRSLNNFINGAVYFGILIFVVYVLINLRARLHPVSLLEEEFVLPGIISEALEPALVT